MNGANIIAGEYVRCFGLNHQCFVIGPFNVKARATRHQRPHDLWQVASPNRESCGKVMTDGHSSMVLCIAADEPLGGFGIRVAKHFYAPADFGKKVAGFQL